MSRYRPSSARAADSQTGRLEDHRFLAPGPIRDLFDELRERCLKLGPDVRMRVMRQYVAFKADTNFVEIVPQWRRLQLTINMEFNELDDPHGIAEDVTTLGARGNGDMRVPLASVAELDYVMSLVEQSYRSHSSLSQRRATEPLSDRRCRGGVDAWLAVLGRSVPPSQREARRRRAAGCSCEASRDSSDTPEPSRSLR